MVSKLETLAVPEHPRSRRRKEAKAHRNGKKGASGSGSISSKKSVSFSERPIATKKKKSSSHGHLATIGSGGSSSVSSIQKSILKKPAPQLRDPPSVASKLRNEARTDAPAAGEDEEVRKSNCSSTGSEPTSPTTDSPSAAKSAANSIDAETRDEKSASESPARTSMPPDVSLLDADSATQTTARTSLPGRSFASTIYTNRDSIVGSVLTSASSVDVGICGSRVPLPWNCGSAEEIHMRIQQELSMPSHRDGRNSRLIHLETLRQGFPDAVDSSLCGRQMPASFHGALNSVKERFRSEPVEEEAEFEESSSSYNNGKGGNDNSTINSESCYTSPLVEAVMPSREDLEKCASMAKQTMQTTAGALETFGNRAKEKLGPAIERIRDETEKGCSDGTAWCHQNTDIVLMKVNIQNDLTKQAQRCFGSEVDVVSEEEQQDVSSEKAVKGGVIDTIPDDLEVLNQSSSRGMIDPPADDDDDDDNSIVQGPGSADHPANHTFMYRLRNAGVVIMQHCAALLPPHGSEEENIMFFKIPPGFVGSAANESQNELALAPANEEPNTNAALAITTAQEKALHNPIMQAGNSQGEASRAEPDGEKDVADDVSVEINTSKSDASRAGSPKSATSSRRVPIIDLGDLNCHAETSGTGGQSKRMEEKNVTIDGDISESRKSDNVSSWGVQVISEVEFGVDDMSEAQSHPVLKAARSLNTAPSMDIKSVTTTQDIRSMTDQELKSFLTQDSGIFSPGSFDSPIQPRDLIENEETIIKLTDSSSESGLSLSSSALKNAGLKPSEYDAESAKLTQESALVWKKLKGIGKSKEAQAHTLVNCIMTVDDSSVSTKGTAKNPIIVVDDSSNSAHTSAAKVINLGESPLLRGLDDQTALSSVTGATNSVVVEQALCDKHHESSLLSPAADISNNLKEHLKGLVDDYMKRSTEKPTGKEEVTANEVVETLLDSWKSKMKEESKKLKAQSKEERKSAKKMAKLQRKAARRAAKLMATDEGRELCGDSQKLFEAMEAMEAIRAREQPGDFEVHDVSSTSYSCSSTSRRRYDMNKLQKAKEQYRSAMKLQSKLERQQQAPKVKLLADPNKNGIISDVDIFEPEKPAVPSKPKLLADPNRNGMIDAAWDPTLHPTSDALSYSEYGQIVARVDQRDDHQHDSSYMVPSHYSVSDSESRQDGGKDLARTHPWLYQDSRYRFDAPQMGRESPTDASVMHSQNNPSSGEGREELQTRKSVSFHFPESDDEDHTKKSSMRVARKAIAKSVSRPRLPVPPRPSSNIQSSSISLQERGYALQLELARLSQKQKELVAQGNRIANMHRGVRTMAR